MSVLAMLGPAPPGLDVTKCIKMCLIHDLAESVVGDITPADNIPKAEKHRREAETLDFIRHKLLGSVDGGKAGEDIYALWREFEDSQTPESIFAQDLDKVELLLQMLEA
jgi:putative hydrolase of HD superfamily